MSTLPWANFLHAGRVNSDEADRPVLCRHGNKLERTSRKLGVASFPSAPDAIEMLSQLARQIDQQPVRFGVFSDDRARILRDPEESPAVAQQADRVNGPFNFSVVS